MYPVSDGFLRAVKSNTRKYYWTGTIVTKAGVSYEFGAKEIVKGSGYITRQCCGSTEIELGTVYAAEMGITLLSDIDRYTLEDALVSLAFHLVLADGSVEDVPMGIFEVSEANRLAKCLELKAYDFMLRFDRSFNGFETVGTPYDFIALCCKMCRVEFANNRAEIDAMPNGSETLSVYTENDIETCRDVLFYVAQVLGGFFVINREGKLELKKYGTEPVMKVEQRHRFSSSFSDFITRYTAVSSTNKRTQTAEYYALDPDNGLTMNLGVNPLLQFGLEETREGLCRNILADLSVIRYVPFDSDTIGNPGFLQTGGNGGCVMKLKGEMVMELTDTNTGEVETIQETNMITDSVNNILGLNPMGIYLKASGEYDESVLWNGTLLPICPNMIGGILLFPAVLESNWGESRLASQFHNYFGLKCGSAWTGKSVNMNTWEEYRPGTMIAICANFRVFDSMEEGAKGYFEFI